MDNVNQEQKSDPRESRALTIVPAGAAEFGRLWNGFVAAQPTAGPFYALSYMCFLESRGPEFVQANDSFLLLREGRPIACVPLLAWVGESTTFSAGGGFNTFYAPLVAANLDEVEARRVRDLCFARIDDLALRRGAAKAMQCIDPINATSGGEYHNHLTRYGYLDASIATKVIDLDVPEQVLNRRRRSSYKSLINNGLRIYQFEVCDAETRRPSIADTYAALHEKAAGRRTRSVESFKRQYRMVEDGEATFLAALHGDRIVQVNFYQHAQGWVYYSSAAPDPDFDYGRYPVQHALTWRAILHFKARGWRWMEMGWIHNGTQPMAPDTPKERSISFFKEGFGGRSIPLFRGIKYYDSQWLRRDINRCIEVFLSETAKRLVSSSSERARIP